MKKYSIEKRITEIIEKALKSAKIKANAEMLVEDSHSFKVITHHTSLNLVKQKIFFSNLQEFLKKYLRIEIDEESMAIVHYPLTLVIGLNIHY